MEAKPARIAAPTPPLSIAGKNTLVNIWIPAALLRGQGSESYHVYQIFCHVGQDEWNVYRRYTHFADLHRQVPGRDCVCLCRACLSWASLVSSMCVVLVLQGGMIMSTLATDNSVSVCLTWWWGGIGVNYFPWTKDSTTTQTSPQSKRCKVCGGTPTTT